MEVLTMGLGDVEPMVVIGKDGVLAVVVGAGGDTAEEWVAIAREDGKVNVVNSRGRGERGSKLGHGVA